MKSVKRFLLAMVIFAGLAGVIVAMHPAPVMAAPAGPLLPPDSTSSAAKDEICAGVGAASGTGGCTTKEGEPTVDSVINTVVNILSLIVGIVAVIMVIYSGFKYVTSGGDSSKISSAKTTLIYALVGIAVAALARPLVQYVLTKVL